MKDDPRILLVDDDQDDVDLTRLAFREADPACGLMVARDGVEALDYLLGRGAHAGRDVADTPALVLLDLKLPKIDGLEVLKAMRAHRLLRYVVVVVLTSSDEEADRTWALGLGANLYFRKAIGFEETVAMARRVLELASCCVP